VKAPGAGGPWSAAAAALAAAVAGVREAAAAVVEGAAACQAEVEAGGVLPAGHRQGLTLVHFSAQRKHLVLGSTPPLFGLS